jgi:hypothetical protein
MVRRLYASTDVNSGRRRFRLLRVCGTASVTQLSAGQPFVFIRTRSSHLNVSTPAISLLTTRWKRS